uniref:Uncharacterized protein n=1 Tax=Octopus bimaculoides TaxID=37653 RepID=A0A0L8FN53_OCTBM
MDNNNNNNNDNSDNNNDHNEKDEFFHVKTNKDDDNVDDSDHIVLVKSQSKQYENICSFLMAINYNVSHNCHYVFEVM